jgi:lysophospholipase L1-like esterase
MRRSLVNAFLAAGMIVGLLAPVSAAAAPAFPNSMAALGDSITRAYDVCCSYGDHPGQSWSTGGVWYDGISSHYERIKGRNSAITGHAYNDAVTGAKMAGAQAQASAAAAQHADYVTVLLGANDLCTSSPSTMTSTDTFEAQFRQAMAVLKQELPQARIFVSSIPDIYQLWKVLKSLPARPPSTRSWPRAATSTGPIAAGTAAPPIATSSAPARSASWTSSTPTSTGRRRWPASPGPPPGGRRPSRTTLTAQGSAFGRGC